MPAFLVTYDLTKPETHEDYERLWARLKQWRARKVLYSEWLLSATTTAAALRDDIAQYVDANDRLLVVQVPGAAWKKLMISDTDARAIIES